MSSAPTPIAFCITELDVGGAENALVELATRLPRERYLPAVYCLGPPPRLPELPARLEQAAVPVHYCRGRSSWHAGGVLRRLSGLLQQQRPAVVQNFLWHANIVGTLAARRARVPHVLTGLRVTEQGWFRRQAMRMVDRIAARHVCVSRSVADDAAGRLRLSAEKRTVIPNGIDLQRFTGVEPAELAQFGVPSAAPVTVAIGRLARQKRFSWLIGLFPHLRQHVPDAHLLIVGEGPLAKQHRQQVIRLGLDQCVHFAGWRDDVPAILTASRLLVSTSLWEGMPNVVLEAMAAGLPVVATQAGGVIELLGERATEQSVSVEQRAGLVTRWSRLLQQPEEARELGAANRRRAVEEFSVQRMVQRYDDLYQALFGGETIASGK